MRVNETLSWKVNAFKKMKLQELYYTRLYFEVN